MRKVGTVWKPYFTMSWFRLRRAEERNNMLGYSIKQLFFSEGLYTLFLWWTIRTSMGKIHVCWHFFLLGISFVWTYKSGNQFAVKFFCQSKDSAWTYKRKNIFYSCFSWIFSWIFWGFFPKVGKFVNFRPLLHSQ